MYEYITIAQLKTKIHALLGDDGVFWPNNELDLAINEALLTFGAISNFWQEEIFVETQLGKRIYNLFTDNNAVNSISPSISFQTLMDWINIDLIENISELNPISESLTLEELKAKLKYIYGLYQRLTNLVLSIDERDIGASITKINLLNETIDVVRVSFIYSDINNDDVEIVLKRTDEKELQYFDADSLSENDLPSYYTSTYGSNKNIRLYPSPIVNGKLRIICVNGFAANQIIDGDTIIPLPNNLVPYLKYGIEKEIYNKDGVAKDSAKYAYCNRRWEEGIMIGLNYNSILIPKVNDRLIGMESLHEMDLYAEDTIIPATTSVDSIGVAGFNIIQTNNLPDIDIDSISLLCIQNAILPQADEDFIQIESSYINALAEYCVHVLQMKSGVFDLAATNDGYENFIQTALAHNQRLQFRGITFESLVQSSKEEEKFERRIATVQK